ncbi:hypothetical protein PAXINDRAFT_153321 [Paxillus involutus ATCC 200175]|nr:hypothetical protein PAXINDRAFT_153321 [Paxillus involutus ATCC 200175]
MPKPYLVFPISSLSSHTLRYLLTFDAADTAKLVCKVPNGWLKLAKGLGCWAICLAVTLHKVRDIKRIKLENRVNTSQIVGELVPKAGEWQSGRATCGDEDHPAFECPLCQCLLASDSKSWMFIVPETSEEAEERSKMELAKMAREELVAKAAADKLGKVFKKKLVKKAKID